MSRRTAALGAAVLMLAAGMVHPVAAQGVAPTRGPYLQQGTSNSVIVRWRTETESDSRVRYGPAPGDLTEFVDAAGITAEHEVALTGLDPGTRYYYSVGSTTEQLVGGGFEHFFQTAPESGNRDATRIWVLGDSGTNDDNQRSVRDAYYGFNGDRYTDLWLMLGDNAYPDGTDDEYQAAVFETYPEVLRQTALWPTLGNHDGHSASSDSQSGPYYDIFSLPFGGEAGGVASGTEAYYSFDFGNVHFICLNSYDVDRSTDAAMLTWLAEDLMEVTADWTIAFWHHPPYSKGSHDSDSSSRETEMRGNALPILEDWGVDLVMSGHSHSYERSFLLDGHYGTSDTLTGGMLVDAGDGRPGGDGAYEKPSGGPASHEGAVYIVAGSSGKTSGGDLDHPAMVASLDELGSLVLDVQGDRLDGTFLGDNGQALDTFAIVKNVAGGPIADFEGAPRSGAEPLEVQFTDRSTGATSWSWDLDGDGTTDSTERNPSWTYTESGSYAVTLTVTNSFGQDGRTRSDYVEVTPGQNPPDPPTGLRFDGP